MVVGFIESRAAVTLVALILLVAGACRPRRGIEKVLQSGAASEFNLVLLTLDTTRADHLGAYGYQEAETPVLDRLAGEGIRFADAISPVPLTLPAHVSILTGLDPQNHGVRHNGQYRLEASHTTLAEVLNEQGYETAAFVSAFVLDRRYGLAQGFDHYDDRVAPATGQALGGLESERSAEEVTEAALDWLRSRASAKPYFVWVHYYDPHAEYRPPEAYVRRFGGKLYDGEIAYVDAQVGRLVEALGDAGSRTLLLVAGDHGEGLGEHGEELHGRLLYEATQRVPLIIWSPPIVRGPYVVDTLVAGLVDLFPTVLDLLGVAPTGPYDGVSLLGAREWADRALYMETMAPYLDSRWAPLHGLRRHRDKFISAPRPEYYDLASDIGEGRNLYNGLSDEARKAVTDLEKELAERLKNAPSAEAVAEAAGQPDPEALAKLQALGYLTGPGPHRSRGAATALPDPKDMMPVQRLLYEARGLRRAGRLGEALAKAQEALRRAPKDLEVLQETGLVFIEMDRLDEAEEVLWKYSALQPNPNINILLCQILAQTGRPREAEALIREAMALEPDHGGVLITYGDFLAERGQYERAFELYDQAKRVDPYRATDAVDQRVAALRRRISGG